MPRKRNLSKPSGRRSDWADDEAEELFEFVRAEEPDDQVIRRIATALRSARLLGQSEVFETMRQMIARNDESLG